MSNVGEQRVRETLRWLSEHPTGSFVRVRRFLQAWVNERCCPDILFYEQDLVENIQELVNSQVRYLTSAVMTFATRASTSVTVLPYDRPADTREVLP